MTRQRTFVSSTSISAVDLLAHRGDVEVELIAGPARSPGPRRPEYGRAVCGYCWRCAAALRPGRACVAARRRPAVPLLRQWAGIQRFATRARATIMPQCGWTSTLLLFVAAPAAAQVNADASRSPAPASVPIVSVFNPAADYITIGQDELGYRSWYGASLRHAGAVKASTTISRNGACRASCRPGSCCAPRRRGSVAVERRSKCRRPASGRTSSRRFATSTTMSSRPSARSRPSPPIATRC